MVREGHSDVGGCVSSEWMGEGGSQVQEGRSCLDYRPSRHKMTPSLSFHQQPSSRELASPSGAAARRFSPLPRETPMFYEPDRTDSVLGDDAQRLTELFPASADDHQSNANDMSLTSLNSFSSFLPKNNESPG